MALDMLLRYLQDNHKTMNIQFGGNIIPNVKIECYDLSKDRLVICTSKGRELRVGISKYKKVVFNAVSPGAQTPNEMQRCLYHLAKIESFNAYLINKYDEFFFNFLCICDKNDED